MALDIRKPEAAADSIDPNVKEAAEFYQEVKAFPPEALAKEARRIAVDIDATAGGVKRAVRELAVICSILLDHKANAEE